MAQTKEERRKSKRDWQRKYRAAGRQTRYPERENAAARLRRVEDPEWAAGKRKGNLVYAQSAKGQATREIYRAKRRALIEEFKSGGCIICGGMDITRLAAHHVGVKSFKIANGYRCAVETLIKELAKCVCLCASCHTKVHRGTAELPPPGESDVIADVLMERAIAFSPGWQGWHLRYREQHHPHFWMLR